MGMPEKKKKELFENFERGLIPTEPNLSQRPISETAGKIVKAILVVDVTTFVGSLFNDTNAFPSMLGCLVGVWVARGLVFKKADVLERTRWNRYWHGDLLGYWLFYIPILSLAMANLSNDAEQTATMMVGAYVVACLAGMLLGFVNVWRRDRADKVEILQCLEEWRASKAQRPLAGWQFEKSL